MSVRPPVRHFPPVAVALLLAQPLVAVLARPEGISAAAILGWQVPFWASWVVLLPLVRRSQRALLAANLGVARYVAAQCVLFVGLLGAQYVIVWILVPAVIRAAGVGTGYARISAFVALAMSMLAYGFLAAQSAADEYRRRSLEADALTLQLRAHLSDARHRALRAYLHPHFLFNALHTLGMLIRAERGKDAVRFLVGLSDLLRYVLDEDRPNEIPLRDELAFAERYLKVEQERFSDRLRVHVDAASETLDAFVPTLILQPIVENAIRHGIAMRTEAALVEITARRRGGDVVVSVRDDGRGLRDGGSSAGLGLRNTAQRLRTMYGDVPPIDVADSLVPPGVTTTIVFPFRGAPALQARRER